MKIPLESLNLDDVSPIRVRFSLGRSRRNSRDRILVIKYSGTYRPDPEGKLDARYLVAMGNAGATAWEPDGALLDFSDLDYRGGDDFGRIFEIGDKVFGLYSLPLAILTGPLCDEAILKRFRDGHGEDDWIFRDLNAAWEYLEGEMEDLWERMFGKRVVRSPQDSSPDQRT